jgi:protein-disulfide isomerase
MDENIKFRPKKWKKIVFIIFGSILLLIIVIVDLIVFGVFKNPNSPEAQQKALEQKISLLKTAVGDGTNYYLGTSTPKVLIVEFADFACPYCQKSYTTIRELGMKYKDTIKIIFRDYPLHENSVDLAIAARCAGEQGKFWPMHDKLFQLADKLAPADLPEIANNIGADKTRYNECVDTKKYLPKIEKDFADGQTLGISGTPTWVINGYVVEGDIPLGTFEEIISKF